jgi:heme oxygenase (mycobilin-producing)
MNMFITSGTYHFLHLVKEKYPNENLLFMQNNEQALLLHETDGSTLFKTPRTYEVMDSIGKLSQEGFVAMHYFPVTDEGVPVFEHHINQNSKHLLSTTGFVAYRLLKPKRKDNHLILSIWEKEVQYREWLKSPSYSDLFHQDKPIGIDESLLLLSPGKYVSTYYLVTEKK